MCRYVAPTGGDDKSGDVMVTEDQFDCCRTHSPTQPQNAKPRELGLALPSKLLTNADEPMTQDYIMSFQLCSTRVLLCQLGYTN